MGVGINLKRILAERNMSIKKLSELTGIQINTLYSITKRDSINVNKELLSIIATALGITTWDLTIDTKQIKREVAFFEQIDSTFGKGASALVENYDKLNSEGQRKASEYVSDLTEQSKYKKEPSPAATDNGSDED